MANEDDDFEVSEVAEDEDDEALLLDTSFEDTEVFLAVDVDDDDDTSFSTDEDCPLDWQPEEDAGLVGFERLIGCL